RRVMPYEATTSASGRSRFNVSVSIRRPGLVERIMADSIRADRGCPCGTPRCQNRTYRALARHTVARWDPRRYWHGRRGRGQFFEVARVGGGQSIFGFAGDDLQRDTVPANQQQALALVGAEQELPLLGGEAE